MQCQYCKEEKKLCKAHIIPESFIRFMYPSGKVEGLSLVMLAERKEYPSYPRVGLYDETILCAECDGEIGRKYDEYGKTIFLDTEPRKIKGIDSGDALVFEGADSDKAKLFLLSVLWRFSISNLPELTMKLPQKFENSLLEMIKNNKAGDLDDFSTVITLFSYQESQKELRKYFQTPGKTRMNGINYWDLYLPNGYKILIKVDSRKQLEELAPLSMATNKPVYVVRYEDFVKTHEFKKLLQNKHKIKKWE